MEKMNKQEVLKELKSMRVAINTAIANGAPNAEYLAKVYDYAIKAVEAYQEPTEE